MPQPKKYRAKPLAPLAAQGVSGKPTRKPTRADFERAKEILTRFQTEACTTLPLDLSAILCQGGVIAYQRLRQMQSEYALDAAFKKQEKKKVGDAKESGTKSTGRGRQAAV